MKLVIDSHILLWWVTNDRKLPLKALRLIENTRNTVFVSVASIWEISIKQSLGRLKIDLAELEEALTANNIESLPIQVEHAVKVSELPPHHSDPFDRMLVAQCLSETAYLVTHDQKLQDYGKFVLVV